METSGPKYSAARGYQHTPKILVQGSEQTSITGSPQTLTNKEDTSVPVDTVQEKAKIRKVRGDVKILTLKEDGNKDVQVHIIDHAPRPRNTNKTTSSGHTSSGIKRPLFLHNARKVPVSTFLEQGSKKNSTKANKILSAVPNKIQKSISEDTICEESSSNLALKTVSDFRFKSGEPTTGRFPKSRYMNYQAKTTSAKNTIKKSTIRKNNEPTRNAASTKIVQSKNKPGSNSAIALPKTPQSKRNQAPEKQSQATSTPNSKNKTFFEPDISVVQPSGKATVITAHKNKGEVKNKIPSVNNRVHVKPDNITQHTLEVAWARCLRARLIEKKIKEDYQQRQKQAVEVLAHRTKQVVELEQKVADIDKRVLTLQHNKTFSQDLHSQHALLVPLVKDVDKSVAHMQDLTKSVDSVRHNLPVVDVEVTKKKDLQRALAKLEVNMEKVSPFISTMENTGEETCVNLFELADKNKEICENMEVMDAMQSRAKFEDIYLSNLENQYKLRKEQ